MQKTALPLHRRVAGLFFSRLARASAWMFIGNIAAGILGYVFQVLMGRMLSTQEYGLFSAIMALFAVLAAPLGTLLMVVSRKVSEYRAMQDSGSMAYFYYSTNIRSAIVGALFLCICVLFAPQMQSYLRAPSVVPVYLLGALLFLTFPPVINNAFLQGLQRFSWFSATISLGVLLKIVFSVVLVWVGYGVAGAIGGVILSSLASWFIAYGALHGPLAEGRGRSHQAANLSFNSILPVFIANAAFTAMTQLDMMFVNYFFPAHEAGLYAAASILGKAVLYLPGGIALALFPMVAENHARNQASAHLLLQAFGLTALLCSAGAVFYYLFGEEIIAFLYGESYQGAGVVLKYFGFAMLPMALVMVGQYFVIAKGRLLFAYLFGVTAPLQLTAIYFYHESLQMIVFVMGVSGLLVTLIGYGLMYRAFIYSR